MALVGGQAVAVLAHVPAQGYIVHLFRELIDKQSWSDEGSVSQRMLRSYLLLFACVRGHPPCVRAAAELFGRWRESNGTLRSALQPRQSRTVLDGAQTTGP